VPKPSKRVKESRQESQIPKLSLGERETVIVKTGEDRAWTVYSCEPAMVRKLRKLALAYGVPVRELNFGGVEADLPAKAVALRPPSHRPAMTEEQRKVAAERMRGLRRKP
jgi:hypothetical protein